MFCKKCGMRLDDDALFCENCGIAINRAETIAAESVVTELGQEHTHAEDITATEMELPVEAATVPVGEEAPAEDSTGHVEVGVSENKTKLIPKWVLLAGIVAVAIIVIAVIAGGRTSNTDSFYNEMNFNNAARFAYDSSRLYFVGEYHENDEGSSVFSTDYKGVNKKLISDNDDISKIRVVDGNIYYYENGDEKYTLGVMNTDGSGNLAILELDEPISKYSVSGNQLYYLTDSGIFSCDLTGENITLLVEKADTFTLADGVIYYVYDDVITEYHIKKDSSTELCKSAGATDLAMNGSTLYFVCDNGLSCVDVKGDGTVTRMINDSDLDAYVFFDDYIYYNSTYESDEIVEMAEYLAEDSEDLTFWGLALIGTGDLYRANIDGSGVHEVEDTDDNLIFTLYTSPGGLYYKLSAWSDVIDKVEFD